MFLPYLFKITAIRVYAVALIIVDLMPSLGDTNDLRIGRLHAMQTAVWEGSVVVRIIRVVCMRQSYHQHRGILSFKGLWPRGDMVEARKLVTVQISVESPKRRLETCLFSLLQLFLLYAPCVCVCVYLLKGNGQKRELPVLFGQKRMYLENNSGREGCWPYLIGQHPLSPVFG